MTYQLQNYTLQRSELERSLEIIEKADPDIGAEFKMITQAALYDFDTNDSWTYSFLNRTGAPLEFSFSSMSDDLRYTLEVGGAQILPESKLSALEDLLIQLGYNWKESEIESYMQKIQNSTDLEWGAWLGVRHGKGGTSFKKYTEVPKQNDKNVHFLLHNYLPGFVKSFQNHASLVMLGHKLGSQGCEFYFELNREDLTTGDLSGLLDCVGLAHRRTLLVELIRLFHFRRESDNQEYLPKAQWGFSYSVQRGASHSVFSLYAMTTDLLGGDGFVRRQFLTKSVARVWNTSLYAELSAPIASWGLHSQYHNMISFIISEADLGIQLSISPPPPNP